jgi:hypothetical protein
VCQEQGFERAVRVQVLCCRGSRLMLGIGHSRFEGMCFVRELVDRIDRSVRRELSR